MSPTNLDSRLNYHSKLMAKITLNPNTNSIITQSNSNPEWSSISLTQESYTISNGIIQAVKLSGLLKAKTEVLEGMITALGLKAGMEFPLAHTLVVTESYNPFWAGQTPKINPSTGEIFLKEGKPVFRKTDVVMGITPNTYVFVEDATPVKATVSEAIEAFENAGANL